MAISPWNKAAQKVKRHHQNSMDFTYSAIKARLTGEKVSNGVTNEREKKYTLFYIHICKQEYLFILGV